MLASKKVSKSKVTKSTIAKRRPTTLHKEPWEVDFRIGCMITGVKTADLKPKHFEALISLLYLWSDRPEAIDIKEFLNYQRILLCNVRDYTSSESFEEAYQVAKQRVALNRERNAIKHNPEGVAFKTMQGFYDEEWVKQEGRLATLRNREDDGKAPTHIGILSYKDLKDLSDKHRTENNS